MVPHYSLDCKLQGHRGCVNRLAFNVSGTLLASASDDLRVCIFRTQTISERPTNPTAILTEHTANMFGVGFVHGDTLVASCGMDKAVCVTNIATESSHSLYRCHSSRVKELCVDANDDVFLTAGEDGTVRIFDIRTPHRCSADGHTRNACPETMLLATAPRIPFKSIHIHPLFSHYFLVGCDDQWIRVFDRRMIKTPHETNESATAVGADPVAMFAPAHLKSTHHATFAQFSPDGREIVASYNTEQIYTFDWTKGQPEYRAYHKQQRQATSAADDYSVSSPELTPSAEWWKARGNDAIKSNDYNYSIADYTLALLDSPHSSILYSNRGIALLRRNCAGDIHCALSDAETAVRLKPDNAKAVHRLATAHLKLSHFHRAKRITRWALTRFAENEYHTQFAELRTEIKQKAAAYAKDNKRKPRKAAKRNKSHRTYSRLDMIKTQHEGKNSADEATDASMSTESAAAIAADDKSDDDDDQSDDDSMSGSSSSEDEKEANGSSSSTSSSSVLPPNIFTSARASTSRRQRQFLQRFVGHSNVQTDIKEATFFGKYLLSGSDDGRVFMWDRTDGRLVNVLHGSEQVVNCVRGQPNSTTIVSSGIDDDICVWNIKPNDGGDEAKTSEADPDDKATMSDGVPNTSSGRDFNTVVASNQRRMSEGPPTRFILNDRQGRLTIFDEALLQMLIDHNIIQLPTLRQRRRGNDQEDDDDEHEDDDEDDDEQQETQDEDTHHNRPPAAE